MNKSYSYLHSLFLALAFLVVHITTQAQEVQESEEQLSEKADTTSLLHAFKKGRIEGHFRYFFMATHNENDLSDYYANAIGGGIKYETAPFKGLQLGIGGFFIYNIGSSDMSVADEKTGQMNRYEIGLFDITDPNNKYDIDRLEELYLKYNWRQSKITVGAQIINTPFINEQDGRMRPTGVGGVYLHYNEIKNTKIEGGFISSISPRSTVEWHSVARSIGVYPQGVGVNGEKNDYAENTRSLGLVVFDATHQPMNGLALKVSDLFVENVFNTMLLQADYSRKIAGSADLSWFAGVQGIAQTKVGNGGNNDPSKAYYGHQKHAFSFGWRAGLKNNKWNASANFNRITSHGQYLMPREWGRDPFYTFLPRERSEGFGDVTAWVVRGGYYFHKTRLKGDLGLGTVSLPKTTNYRLNKYGLPSYHHLLFSVDYQLKGLMQGADIQLLYVYKFLKGERPDAERNIINKVNMGNFNLVFNYRF